MRYTHWGDPSVRHIHKLDRPSFEPVKTDRYSDFSSLRMSRVKRLQSGAAGEIYNMLRPQASGVQLANALRANSSLKTLNLECASSAYTLFHMATSFSQEQLA